jgi:flagellar assembly protein FliH
MSRVTPYTFDREFDRDGTLAKRTAQLKYTLTADELAAVKAEAFAEGAKAAAAETEKQAAVALHVLGERVVALGKALDDAIRPARGEAIKLAYLIARKLAQSLVEARPQAEIEALIGQCLDEQRSEPHIVIRVNDGLLDRVKARADELSRESSFPGRILVIGEPQIKAGDCTIEWSNGGAERDLEKQIAAVDEIVRTYLHAEGMDGFDGAPPPAPSGNGAQVSAEGGS